MTMTTIKIKEMIEKQIDIRTDGKQALEELLEIIKQEEQKSENRIKLRNKKRAVEQLEKQKVLFTILGYNITDTDKFTKIQALQTGIYTIEDLQNKVNEIYQEKNHHLTTNLSDNKYYRLNNWELGIFSEDDWFQLTFFGKNENIQFYNLYSTLKVVRIKTA